MFRSVSCSNARFLLVWVVCLFSACVPAQDEDAGTQPDASVTPSDAGTDAGADAGPTVTLNTWWENEELRGCEDTDAGSTPPDLIPRNTAPEGAQLGGDTPIDSGMHIVWQRTTRFCGEFLAGGFGDGAFTGAHYARSASMVYDAVLQKDLLLVQMSELNPSHQSYDLLGPVGIFDAETGALLDCVPVLGEASFSRLGQTQSPPQALLNPTRLFYAYNNVNTTGLSTFNSNIFGAYYEKREDGGYQETISPPHSASFFVNGKTRFVLGNNKQVIAVFGSHYITSFDPQHNTFNWVKTYLDFGMNFIPLQRKLYLDEDHTLFCIGDSRRCLSAVRIDTCGNHEWIGTDIPFYHESGKVIRFAHDPPLPKEIANTITLPEGCTTPVFTKDNRVVCVYKNLDEYRSSSVVKIAVMDLQNPANDRLSYYSLQEGIVSRERAEAIVQETGHNLHEYSERMVLNRIDNKLATDSNHVLFIISHGVGSDENARYNSILVAYDIDQDHTEQIDLPVESSMDSGANIDITFAYAEQPQLFQTRTGMTVWVTREGIFAIQTPFGGLAPTKYPRGRLGGNDNRGYARVEE